MLAPIKVGPDLGGFRGAEDEEEMEEEGREEGEDAYKVELAAPVLMLREFERPNMVLAVRRPAPRNA